MTGAQRKFVLWLYVSSTILSYVGVVALTVLEMYVRWSLNQDFAFLGGFGLEALILLALGQTLGLLYLLRTEK